MELFAEERKERIMEELTSNKRIVIKELAERFSVTEETIRRDIKALEKQGLVERMRGGAVLTESLALFQPHEVRERVNVSAKEQIGRLAASLVNDGDTIFIDASTTCLCFARNLVSKQGVTIITTSLNILYELSGYPNLTLIGTGGLVKQAGREFIGREAEENIRRYRASKTFYSSTGFDLERGSTSSMGLEADMQRCMLQQAETAVYLVDHTKIGKIGYTPTCSLDEIDYMITDSPLPAGYEPVVRAHGIRLIVGGEET